ncbi:MAG: hypothetical protein WBB67_06435 [bacterium]
MENLIKWISLSGAVLAIILTILKIVEILKNKPALVITYGSYCFDYVKGATEITASFEITNVGTKPTTLKKYIIHLSDDKKKEVDFFGKRIYEANKKLSPSDYFEEWIVESVQRELANDKYYLRLDIITSHKSYVRFIELNKCMH